LTQQSSSYLLSCRLYQKHADVAALAARTELSFAQHNRSSYALGEEVTLHLATKNVVPQVMRCWPTSHWLQYCWAAADTVLLLLATSAELTHRSVAVHILLCTAAKPIEFAMQHLSVHAKLNSR
jgi:hypothetical protein